MRIYDKQKKETSKKPKISSFLVKTTTEALSCTPIWPFRQSPTCQSCLSAPYLNSSNPATSSLSCHIKPHPVSFTWQHSISTPTNQFPLMSVNNCTHEENIFHSRAQDKDIPFTETFRPNRLTIKTYFPPLLH